jgi:two-component system, NtrC family, response regulator
MTPGNILIIDDEEKLRQLLARLISLEGYTVFEAAGARHAWQWLEKQEIHLILCDVKLPDAHGVELVEKIKARFPLVEVILLTAYGTIADGVKAMQNGAFDYLVKGDDNEKIVPLTARAMEKALLQLKVKTLEEKVNHRFGFENIIGKAPALRACIDLAKKVAPADTHVLLLGESGTGKEVFAKAIHTASLRKNKPYLALNCSAFQKDLLESELFGYKAGAFTGAVKDKKGLLEEAHDGTAFLDEIGEMPPGLQAKLLRVLETGEFYKVGDTKPTHVNVRFIAATNRNLEQEVEGRHFRLDLFYRLSVFQISLPRLAERKEDIEELACHFAGIYANKMNKKLKSIHPDFLAKLPLHPWKGNIRELKNVMERAVILMEDGELEPQHLPFEMTSGEAAAGHSFELSQVEKQHIRRVLQHTGNNKTEAARLLGIGLTTLYRKLEEIQS